MREDVLSLHAMGGDPVSEEYLKAELYHRAEALKDIPDTPLFFGRLDYAGPPETGQSESGQSETRNYGSGISGTGQSGPVQSLPVQSGTVQSGDDGIAGNSFHIGRRHVHAPDGTPAVIDWRAPVSRPFYRASATEPMNLARRRRFGFSGGELTAYEDELFAGTEDSTPDRSAPVAVTRPSRILIDEIERPRSGPMRDIVATIQPDQDDIVRADAAQTVVAASARTMSSWSGWMVATMSRMGPDRGRSISSIRIRLGWADLMVSPAERVRPSASVPKSSSS